MSYSFDTNGWDLFNTPFSTSVRQASPKQQAEQTQQKPSEASLHSTTMTDAQHSALPMQRTVQQKTPSAQRPEPAQSATAHVQNKRPAPSTAQAQTDARKPGQAAPSEAPATAQTDTTRQEQTAPPKSTVPASVKPAEPQKELVLDMSSGTGAVSSGKSDNTDDTAKRKAHEAAEAKRKAEWDARQQAKKQKEAEAIQKLQNMSDADIIAASTQRISLDVERITRRNMKECVSEHIQDLCRKDPAFARLTMHPKKSMINCFRYINRKAKDFILQEMEENGIPKDSGGYGSDVPDGLVYQFAEDYFNDTDAPEDQEKEEKFIPKSYAGAAAKAKKAAPKAKKSEKPAGKAQKQEQSGNYEQMTLGV